MGESALMKASFWYANFVGVGLFSPNRKTINHVIPHLKSKTEVLNSRNSFILFLLLFV